MNSLLIIFFLSYGIYALFYNFKFWLIYIICLLIYYIFTQQTFYQYPVDKKAGFMSALYTMNPAFPYTDLQGNSCSDVHSVALALLAQQPQYGICLQRPNDPLFLWLETHVECDINRLRSYFTPDADSRVAVLKLVYEIDPEVPFLARHPSSTVKEISHAYGYCNLSDDDWQALCDGRLLSWMYSHEDMMACESLRILTQHKPYSVQLAYKVLYNLDREAAYDLREANTPEQRQVCGLQVLYEDRMSRHFHEGWQGNHRQHTLRRLQRMQSAVPCRCL